MATLVVLIYLEQFVLGGGDIAASEELLGSQGLLAEHLDLNKDLLCRELEHYK